MIKKIYNRKEEYWDILISGQQPYDVDIDGVSCMGGAPNFQCFCDLEILRNETGVGFPTDVTLDVKMELVSNQRFFENILIYRSCRSKNINIEYYLFRKPLDEHEKTIKAHFSTCEDGISILISEMKPEENLYDKIMKDIGLLSLYTREFTADELEKV